MLVFICFLVLIAGLLWTSRRHRPIHPAPEDRRYTSDTTEGTEESSEPDMIDDRSIRAGGPDGPITATSTFPVMPGIVDREAYRETARQRLEYEMDMMAQSGLEPDYAMMQRALSDPAIDEAMRTAHLPRFDDHPPEIDATPDSPHGWAGRVSWMAVRSDAPEAVAKALNVVEAEPCNWQSGVEYGHWDGYGLGITGMLRTVFISPPVDGWVLVLQNDAAIEDRAVCRAIMAPLSAQFGEVQAFATQQTSGIFGWARAIDGQLVRQTSWFNEKLDNFGALTEGEAQMWRETMGQEPPDTAAEFSIRFDFTQTSPHDLARHWSIDPRDLDSRNDLKERAELGIAGMVYPPER